jgi:hypothetical protein
LLFQPSICRGRGAEKIREIFRSLGSANRYVGDGHLCNSNNGFLENIARNKMEGRAIRRGALSHTTYQIHVKFERHLDVASCRLPDDGARL